VAASGKTAEAVALRNAKIVRYRARHPSMTIEDVAKACGVSKRTAEYALARKSDERVKELVHVKGDTAAYVAKKLAQFDELREQVMEILEHPESDASVRVGALKTVLSIYDREIRLLQHTEMLPQDLGIVRFQVDADYVAEVVTEVIAELARNEAQRRYATERIVHALFGEGGEGGEDAPLALTTGNGS
jgi:AcrR family transcriptional regulator